MEIDKVKQGKRNRKKGSDFEKEVREELELLGYFVFRNSNTVDLEHDKIVPCKPKYNPFTRSLMMNKGGFPDFIAVHPKDYTMQGIECKGGKAGYLDKNEKQMAQWYKDKRVFVRFLIARKPKLKDKYAGISYEGIFYEEFKGI